MSRRLPIYRLSAPAIEPEQLERIGSALFGAKALELQEVDGQIVGREGSLIVSLDRASGGLWAADEARLWQPLRAPRLVSERDVYPTAAKQLGELGLLPDFRGGESFSIARLPVGRSVLATRSRGRRTERLLDLQARYQVKVRNPGIEDAPKLLPVVGGGGKFTLTLGDRGRPIGYQGLWRPTGEAELVEALDLREARERFDELTSHLTVRGVRAFPAYYAAPVSARQDVLAPVYVFGGTVVLGGLRLPMRLVTIPATEFGPRPPKVRPQPPRRRQPGRLTALGARRTHAGGEIREAGTSWIGLSGGLGGSQANAKGFVDGLAADGWVVNFNWGDGNAWESDWRRNDDTWVDAADFVFYTGHANGNGWTLASPDDGSLTVNEVGGGSDLWGQHDLEWLIVAACGPLQDDLISPGGGDVFRWQKAFDGLHILMGYGADTADNTQEGKKIVQYARQGTPLIDAWFRTAKEIQPSTNGHKAPNGPNVWAGAMWVTKPGADPRNDHLWGHGPVSARPDNPTVLACTWTTC